MMIGGGAGTVASPTSVITNPPTPPPGWHPAPDDPARLRYWDGAQWTDHYADPSTPMYPLKVEERTLFGMAIWGWVVLAAGIAGTVYLAVREAARPNAQG